MITSFTELFDKLDKKEFLTGALRIQYEQYMQKTEDVKQAKTAAQLERAMKRADDNYNFLCGVAWTAETVGVIGEDERRNLMSELYALMGEYDEED